MDGARWTTAWKFHHDRFLYDDGYDSGFYSDDLVRPDWAASQDAIDQYKNVGSRLDDATLRQAEYNVQYDWDRVLNPNADPWSLWNNNCQDYCDTVMDEYNRLMDEKRNKNNCNKNSTK